MPPLVPGGRWYSTLLNAYHAPNYVIPGSVPSSRRMLEGWHDSDQSRRMSIQVTYQMLLDTETRRIIVDMEQAETFLEMDRHPPTLPVRFPFEQCYIEFSEPISGFESQADYPDERLLALLIDYTPEMVSVGRRENQPQPTITVMAFFYDAVQDSLGDAGFGLVMDTGEGITRVVSCAGSPDPSEFPDSPEFKDLTGREWMVVRHEGEGIGWWERRVGSLAQFIHWLSAYLTAKGIVIVHEPQPPMSRQYRRQLERLKHRPPPWHVVEVEPTYVTEGDDEHEGGGHGYRYDVRGHLRFGRHRKGDGTYSQTVEWVRPHQRGLRHTVYVPKTYHYGDEAPRLGDLV